MTRPMTLIESVIVPLRTWTVGRDCWELVCAAIVGSGAGPAAGPPPILGSTPVSQALNSTAPAAVSITIRSSAVRDLGIHLHRRRDRPVASMRLAGPHPAGGRPRARTGALPLALPVCVESLGSALEESQT